jgi:hypothetical protein
LQDKTREKEYEQKCPYSFSFCCRAGVHLPPLSLALPFVFVGSKPPPYDLVGRKTRFIEGPFLRSFVLQISSIVGSSCVTGLGFDGAYFKRSNEYLRQQESALRSRFFLLQNTVSSFSGRRDDHSQVAQQEVISGCFSIFSSPFG